MPELQSWFFKYNAWSFTKHRLWGQCKLAYYYRYIGTALRSSNLFRVNDLKRLKNLDPKSVLLGKLVHEVIETQIEQFRQTHSVDENAAKSQYIERVEHYRHNAKTLIVEFHNEQTVNERFFDWIREDGLDQLSLFFGIIWPQLASSQYLRHEEFDRFNASQNVEVIVKVDYVSKAQDEKVIVTDWKTGVDNPQYESALQIGGYVLWATEYYDLEPHHIRSELVYLTTGNVRPYEYSLVQLDEIRRTVVSDFEAMNLSYEIDYFEADPDLDKCRSCHFSTICQHSVIH